MKFSKINFANLNPKLFFSRLKSTGIFIFISTLYLLTRLLSLSKRRPVFVQKIITSLTRAYTKLDSNRTGSIGRVDIVKLAIANLSTKKSRTIVTIGGVTVGITTVVLLVSIGYGLQYMVTSRVARLDEMRQTDIYTQSGSKVTINDKSINDIKSFPEVQSVIPLIAVVGKINYQKSVSDVVVYGVTTEYLKESAIKPVVGKIFSSDELTRETNTTSGKVETVDLTDKTYAIDKKIRDVQINITNNSWLKLREAPDQDSKLIGYVTSAAGGYAGEEFAGYEYLDEVGNGSFAKDSSGATLGKWVKINAQVYTKNGNDFIPQADDQNSPVVSEGYLAEKNMEVIDKANAPAAIATPTITPITSQTTSEVPVGISAIRPGWVEIASESAVKSSLNVKRVILGSSALREAVVNRSMLKMIGLKEEEAVGKEFLVSFIATGNQLEDTQERVESEAENYKIVGVIPDTKSAMFYIPFTDARSLGVVNYSQAKVIVKDQKDLPKIRRQIEGLGFISRSVVDTVNQINQLFSTLKIFLALLGLVALFVASIGMFNTLTVSLMERTREVGLMKVMGMQSNEIRELLLVESLLMSTAGGVLGIIVGMVTGKIIEILLSMFSIFKGAGYVSISYTPIILIIGIIILSLLIGFVTGLYPSRRATKISALDALRYE